MTAREPDERLWELDVTMCDDGDVLLRQGACPECGDDNVVRLHRSHLLLLAEHAGWMAPDDCRRAVGRSIDRLELLAAMVRAHCPERHPLRAAAAALTGGRDDDDGGEGIRPFPHQHGDSGPVPAKPIDEPIVRTDEMTTSEPSAGGQMDLLAGAP